jgi:hypothetical protein
MNAIASVYVIAHSGPLASLFWWPVTITVKRRFASEKIDASVVFSVASVTVLVKLLEIAVVVRNLANPLLASRLAAFVDSLRFTARFSL